MLIKTPTVLGTYKRMGYRTCKGDLMAYSMCILILFRNTTHTYTRIERASHTEELQYFFFTDCRAVGTEFSVRYFQVRAFLHIRQYNVLREKNLMGSGILLAGSISCITEYQAFSPSYDFTPPPPFPPSCYPVVSFSQSSCVPRRCRAF